MRLLLVAGLVFLPGLAAAQERLVSTSTWIVAGEDVALRYAFPRETAALLSKPGESNSLKDTLGSYLLDHVSVSQDANSCDAIDQGFDLGRVDPRYVGDDLFGFEILFRCPAKNGSLVLRNDALFDLDRPHIGLASIRVGGTPPVQRLITSANRELRLSSERPPEPSGPGAYMKLGAQHLLTRLVHWCAICGLFLLARGRRELTFLTAGILGSYLIAAALAGLGDVVLRTHPAAAWDGFLVLLTAALMTARGTGSVGAAATGLGAVSAMVATIAALRGEADVAILLAAAGLSGACLVYCWRDLEDKPARWLVPAAAIGLLDGLSLPSAFAPLHDLASVGTLHVGVFNIGAMFAVLAMFAATAATRAATRRYAGFLTKPFAGDLLTAALTAVGCFCVLVV